jgi:hypothetical protein
MRSRLAALLLVLAGAGLCAVTLAQHTGPAASPFAQVVRHFEPVMTQQGVDQLRADLAVVDAGDKGLTGQALPALARATGRTPQQLQAGLSARYPQVATGLQQLPAITAGFSGFADLLQAQLGDFHAVADIPVDGVEPTVIPPALLGLGALLVLLGLGLLARPRSARVAGAALLLGVVVVATVLTASLPQKADASARLKTALAPVLTRSAITADRAALSVMAGLSAQLQTELLPQTAAALHETPAQLAGQLVAASPALGTLLQQLPQVQARFTGLVDLLDTNLEPWQQASRPSLVVLVRVLLAVAVTAAGAGLLVLSGRRRGPVVSVPVAPALPVVVPAPTPPLDDLSPSHLSGA